MANSTIPVVLDAARANTREWPRRYTVVVLFALATALCYIDRVNISIAIIPLARAKGYDAAAKGLVLSSFFWGYLWLQLFGGWVADRFGGKRVLAAGVAVRDVLGDAGVGVAGDVRVEAKHRRMFGAAHVGVPRSGDACHRRWARSRSLRSSLVMPEP